MSRVRTPLSALGWCAHAIPGDDGVGPHESLVKLAPGGDGPTSPRSSEKSGVGGFDSRRGSHKNFERDIGKRPDNRIPTHSWLGSSVGRALPCHGRGRRFKSGWGRHHRGPRETARGEKLVHGRSRAGLPIHQAGCEETVRYGSGKTTSPRRAGCRGAMHL